MKFIFFGTPDFAKIILEKLIEANFIPATVVTNPDRPVGRKKIITPPPVKKLFSSLRPPSVALAVEGASVASAAISPVDKVNIIQPENLKDITSQLKNINPDFGVLAAYGKIIPKEIIDIFPKGIIVVHPSLLPKYRGATPIQNALLAGPSSAHPSPKTSAWHGKASEGKEKETGTTLILMDEKVDHGAILAQAKIDINDDDNYDKLSKKLAELSADLLIKTLPKYLAGKITPQEQNHSQATYTRKFTSEDGFVDESSLRAAESGEAISLTNNLAEQIWLKIRALNPEPGVYTIKNGRRMKILAADLINGKLILKKIQFAGEKPIEVKPR